MAWAITAGAERPTARDQSARWPWVLQRLRGAGAAGALVRGRRRPDDRVAVGAPWEAPDWEQDNGDAAGPAGDPARA